jgi:hypothetical protein
MQNCRSASSIPAAVQGSPSPPVCPRRAAVVSHVLARRCRRVQPGHRTGSSPPSARDARGLHRRARARRGHVRCVYAFLAERRGPARAVAVDNEQYAATISRAVRDPPRARRRVSGDRRAAALEGRLPPFGRARCRAAWGDVRRHPVLRCPASRRGAADASRGAGRVPRARRADHPRDLWRARPAGRPVRTRA